MRLLALTALTMVAFAANSVLNRMAIVDGGMDAFLFAILRLGFGAAMLAVILLAQKKPFEFSQIKRPIGVLSLLVYLFGFSWAYRELPSGAGALLMFGMVQITMFAAAVRGGESIPALRWFGTVVAFSGLCWLLWPQPGVETPIAAMFSMLIAGIGWGVYSLAGRQAKDAMQATAMNFILAVPVGVFVLVLIPDVWQSLTLYGAFIALLSGAVTSGLGYVLWYAVVPHLGATRAAVAQLTVPVIATLGGAALLSEAITLQLVISTALVLGGVGLALLRK